MERSRFCLRQLGLQIFAVFSFFACDTPGPKISRDCKDGERRKEESDREMGSTQSDQGATDAKNDVRMSLFLNRGEPTLIIRHLDSTGVIKENPMLTYGRLNLISTSWAKELMSFFMRQNRFSDSPHFCLKAKD